MGISSPFYTYNSGDGPDQVGVYELGIFGGDVIVYIGSGSIRNRFLAHARDDEKHWQVYRCVTMNCRHRARQIERREQRRYVNRHDELPLYNDRIG